MLSSENRAHRFLGAGAVVSLIVHVAVGGGVWALGSGGGGGSKKKEKPKEVTMVTPTAPPAPVVDLIAPELPPPPPPKAAAPKAPVVEAKVEQVKPKVDKPKPKKAPDKLVKAPDNAEKKDPSPPAPDPNAGGNQPPDPDGGGEDGGEDGGVKGGKIGGQSGGKLGGTGTTTVVIPFGEGMTRPKRLSGEDPRYTREAIEANVQGVTIAKCVIEIDGRLQNCRIVKALPYMENAVLDALATHRYSPVTFQGQPVRVDYTFNIKLVMPQ